jgi:hypothetical protein
MQDSEPYGPNWHVFGVQGTGGTSLGGEHYGGHNYRVDLERVQCSCNVPQIMHAPCSHMITACRIMGYDHTVLPYMSPLYLRANTLIIWQKSFELYLDPSQCPSYHGPNYAPNLALRKVRKGRRKKNKG